MVTLLLNVFVMHGMHEGQEHTDTHNLRVGFDWGFRLITCQGDACPVADERPLL